MKFVVDTNIVFSAVLNTEGKIGDLLMNAHGIFEFHSCDTLRAELAGHRGKLLEISGMNEEQLDQSIYQITNQIIFTNEALIPFDYWRKAADWVAYFAPEYSLELPDGKQIVLNLKQKHRDILDLLSYWNFYS